ncbi:MAG: hypothetical protein ACRD4L_02130, partial [Pyrinomonadaceae bacterium]
MNMLKKTVTTVALLFAIFIPVLAQVDKTDAQDELPKSVKEPTLEETEQWISKTLPLKGVYTGKKGNVEMIWKVTSASMHG